MSRPVQDIRVRFWNKVNKTDTCWLWRGAVDKTGAGVISWGRTTGGSTKV